MESRQFRLFGEGGQIREEGQEDGRRSPGFRWSGRWIRSTHAQLTVIMSTPPIVYTRRTTSVVREALFTTLYTFQSARTAALSVQLIVLSSVPAAPMLGTTAKTCSCQGMLDTKCDLASEGH